MTQSMTIHVVKDTFRIVCVSVVLRTYVCVCVSVMRGLVLVMPSNILGINPTGRMKGAVEVFHPTGWSLFRCAEDPSSAEFITVNLQWWRTSALAPQVNAFAQARRSCVS